ncbi:hypothetical protein CROQUDRAFT_437246 [Cronartium quercuum f. sp. fusiforme G11]|uniref:Uncharacterized protein n=1 Tax=Cronartium quercuum f. sp. fusiforme G11 TaxID=708437 RepID=A0A9P6N8H1_9BASI|nr:hypothetical protein CROQUDRAFT_437246 [Cronartium quercuum f. sp. fusiforme G11]
MDFNHTPYKLYISDITRFKNHVNFFFFFFFFFFSYSNPNIPFSLYHKTNLSHNIDHRKTITEY